MVLQVVNFVNVVAVVGEGTDVQRREDLIQCVLGIALILTVVDELYHLTYPGRSGGFAQLVKRLKGEAVLVKDFDGYFPEKND